MAAPIPFKEPAKPAPAQAPAIKPKAPSEPKPSALALAAANVLMTASPEIPVPKAIGTEKIRKALQYLATQQEVLDYREVKHVFSRSEDFSSDLHLIQKRYQDLKDAPPLHDCMRFVDRSTVSDMLAFNRKYKEHLEAARTIDLVNAEWYRAAISETEHLYRIWDMVRDARCEYYYVTVRRAALKKLRDDDWVGYERYYSGCLLPHVPIWRFRSID